MLTNVDLETLSSRPLVVVVMLGIAFPIHEFAHALAAYRLGDGTAKLMGRLTLNPRAHFDPMGGLLLAAISVHAHPVRRSAGRSRRRYNPRNLQGGRWGEAIVVGRRPDLEPGPRDRRRDPASVHRAPRTWTSASSPCSWTSSCYINLLLMLFNLIPIPPLDGSKVLFAFLNPRTAWQIRPVLEQYGYIILIGAILLPIFGGQTLIGVVFSAALRPAAARSWSGL